MVGNSIPASLQADCQPPSHLLFILADKCQGVAPIDYCIYGRFTKQLLFFNGLQAAREQRFRWGAEIFTEVVENMRVTLRWPWKCQGAEWISAGVCKDEADGRGCVLWLVICAPWSFLEIFWSWLFKSMWLFGCFLLGHMQQFKMESENQRPWRVVIFIFRGVQAKREKEVSPLCTSSLGVPGACFQERITCTLEKPMHVVKLGVCRARPVV